MSEPRRSIPSWLPPLETTPVPVARSIAEMAETVFRAQDLATRADVEADKQRQRTRTDALAAMRDEAEMRAFMGQPTPSAVEYYMMASEAADRAEEHDRKRRERLRAERAEARVAELEQQVAAAEAARTRSLRTLSQANQAAAGFRQRSEGAGFRDGGRCVYCGVVNGHGHNASCDR
jgi:hypothetical protein